ncbi:hypothetical protein ACET3Z_000721 [Daucus carota]
MLEAEDTSKVESLKQRLVELSADYGIPQLERLYARVIKAVFDAKTGKSKDVIKVACRDYPHPRHLCAKYHFTSTTVHEKHCSQCHCYVRDLLAPCLHWDGNLCHATDK